MIRTRAWAAFSATAPLGAHSIDRRDPGPTDVQIEILYCGVCHSDLHTVRGEWGTPTYPCVPGHEIVGKVVAVGNAVTRFKTGDHAAVGCMVDSCRHCASCTDGLEQYCDNRQVTWTYDSPDRHTGGVTYGGYSSTIVVDEHFVVQVPALARPCRGSTAALRRDHDLLAAPPLERRPRHPRRHCRARRARAHGREARSRDGRARDALHDLSGQDR